MLSCVRFLLQLWWQQGAVHSIILAIDGSDNHKEIVGGVRLSISVPVSSMREGTALHSLCARRLADVLESDKDGEQLDRAEDRPWQLRALGLAQLRSPTCLSLML